MAINKRSQWRFCFPMSCNVCVSSISVRRQRAGSSEVHSFHGQNTTIYKSCSCSDGCRRRKANDGWCRVYFGPLVQVQSPSQTDDSPRVRNQRTQWVSNVAPRDSSTSIMLSPSLSRSLPFHFPMTRKKVIKRLSICTDKADWTGEWMFSINNSAESPARCRFDGNANWIIGAAYLEKFWNVWLSDCFRLLFD